MWTLTHIAALVAGGGLACAGLWLLWGRRVVGVRSPKVLDEPVAPLGEEVRLSVSPGRLVAGMCLVLVGYHVAAYGSPASWFPLQIPADRWWVLVLVVVLALAGTAASEWLERH